MKTLKDLKPGDEVRMFDVNGNRVGVNSMSGVPLIVKKVGRTLVTCERYGRDITFRIDGGRRNDEYRHQWIKTLDEWEAWRVCAERDKQIAKANIQIHGSPLRNNAEFLRELAELVAKYAAKVGGADE